MLQPQQADLGPVALPDMRHRMAVDQLADHIEDMPASPEVVALGRELALLQHRP